MKRSCQKAVNDAAIQRIVDGLPAVSTSTGSFCKARQRLPLTMVSERVCQTGDLIDNQIPEQWRWQGRRVHLIDGKQYGFKLRVCRPYRAQTKGKVERFNGYLKSSFITPLAATLKQAGLLLD